MTHTRLADEVQRLVAQIAVEDGVPITDRRPLSRRALIAGAGAMGLAVAMRSRSARAAQERVVVVGGGLAGLTAAYRLSQAGYSPVVHDANTRFGGRCWTLRGAFDDGQIIERGGELIDTGHTQVKQLAQELGLKLDNLLQAEQNGTEPFFHFDGVEYPYVQATNDLKAIWQKIKSDVNGASYPTLYNLSTLRGRELDAMSIVDWINESVPGGIDAPLGQLLDVAYNIEYGAESSDQSSLNLLYLLGYSGQGQMRIFGPSNEKLHVRGGNDQIVQGLVDRIGQQHLIGGSALTAIAKRSDGTWELTFKQGGRSVSVVADRVALALPFSILRSLDIAGAGFSPGKVEAIMTQGVGRNAKLQLQFGDRIWRNQGKNGDTYSDTGYQATWEVSRAQAGGSGILVDYTGGDTAKAQGSRTLKQNSSLFLSQLEPVVPGITAAWNGKSHLEWWPGSPYMRGSYSYWRVGQYTSIAGREREQQGTCYFAGEHTSVDFQGYLNGAVESGERAASEILADVKAGR
jgi:monoamine oxidase